MYKPFSGFVRNEINNIVRWTSILSTFFIIASTTIVSINTGFVSTDRGLKPVTKYQKKKSVFLLKLENMHRIGNALYISCLSMV